MSMYPPFQLTTLIVKLVSEISHLLGKYEGMHAPLPQPKLRRQNQLRTIQGSLAIEGNTLDLDQVTAIFEERRVIGPKKDILEVQNAIRLYHSWQTFKPNQPKDLLKAHSILMEGLIPNPGKFRSGAVGILKGAKVSHLAPQAKHLPTLMENLFLFLKKDRDLSPLIKASIFHYEFEFIHPFTDGNGRMGRFWQYLLFANFHSAFEYIPVESVIKERQELYYQALEQSDKKGESTLFIEFSLQATRDALLEFMDQLKPATETCESRLSLAQEKFRQGEFSRKEYIRDFKTLSTATASRDLAFGVSHGLLQKTGVKAVTRYKFKKTTSD